MTPTGTYIPWVHQGGLLYATSIFLEEALRKMVVVSSITMYSSRSSVPASAIKFSNYSRHWRKFHTLYARILEIIFFIKSYTADPRIMNKWFFLKEEWNISNVKYPLLKLTNDYRFRIPVCPHLRIIYGGSVRGLWSDSGCNDYGKKGLANERNF